MTYTNRSQFTLRVAAAITGNDPWACGYSEYRGTMHTLCARLKQRRQDHGGNTVEVWFYHGRQVQLSEIERDIDIPFNAW